MDYQDLDNHFTRPEVVSPMYNDGRISRKLKKRIKKHCGVHWSGLTNGQRRWDYLGKTNPEYKQFLIKQICDE